MLGKASNVNEINVDIDGEGVLAFGLIKVGTCFIDQ